MSRIIGIDLGTSNSAAAVMEGGKPTIIPSAEGTTLGGKAFPSYVAFTKGTESQLLIGEPARRQAVSNPGGTVAAFKRKMGTDHKYEIFGKSYTPQTLSGQIKLLEVHDNGIGRDAKELLRKVQAAQYVAAHPWEVCPAKWTPGAETLAPSLDLVGKI